MANIVMVSHSASPDKRIDQEAEYLAKQGHKLYLICGRKGKEESLSKVYEEIYTIPLNRMQQAFYYLPVRVASKKYAKIFAKIKPDVIHAHDLMAAYIVSFIIDKNVKFVYDDHEVWELTRKQKSEKIKNPIKSLIRKKMYLDSKRLNKKIMKKADLVIVVNDYWIKFYEERGIDPKKIIAIENFPKKELIDEALKREDLIDDFFIKDPRRKAVVSSSSAKITFDTSRNVLNYAKAISELDDWVLVIFGPKDEKLVELGAHFVPYKPLIEYLSCCSKCDVAIHPVILNERSHYGSPNRIFESALLGLRIISSKAKTLVDKFNNYIIWAGPETSKEDLIKIFRNIDDYPTGEEIKKIAKSFNWEESIKKLINRYEEILKQP